jgi:DNA-directed RNA polymerase specialized sigma24 family protein
MVQEEIDKRLRNWSFYVAWGQIGPEVRTRCASAEGNYESEDVWDGEEPNYSPDILDGELVENAIRVLPDISRRVLKAVFVQYPYHLKHSVAQRLRISTTRLETELSTAKRRLERELSRNPARDRSLAQSETGARNCVTG